jgi:hypothetical protein
MGAVTRSINTLTQIVAPAPLVAITVYPSPMAYTATSSGFVLIKGGTILSLSLTRAGYTVAINTNASTIPVAPGDVIGVTHSAAPIMTFVPG